MQIRTKKCHGSTILLVRNEMEEVGDRNVDRLYLSGPPAVISNFLTQSSEFPRTQGCNSLWGGGGGWTIQTSTCGHTCKLVPHTHVLVKTNLFLKRRSQGGGGVSWVTTGKSKLSSFHCLTKLEALKQRMPSNTGLLAVSYP